MTDKYYEKDEIEVLKKHFNDNIKNNTFVDVGANIGSYSILAGSCDGVNVLAFEPAPSTFSWLEKNISINDRKLILKPFETVWLSN